MLTITHIVINSVDVELSSGTSFLDKYYFVPRKKKCQLVQIYRIARVILQKIGNR
jgi:hypothetical protein